MKLHIETRGTTIDFHFLGHFPECWWRDYTTINTLERPTAILESDGESWRMLLSGIPSKRQDRAGRQIRFTLEIEGSTKNDQDKKGASSILALWLADLEAMWKKNEKQSKLAKFLDSHEYLHPERIEELLNHAFHNKKNDDFQENEVPQILDRLILIDLEDSNFPDDRKKFLDAAKNAMNNKGKVTSSNLLAYPRSRDESFLSEQELELLRDVSVLILLNENEELAPRFFSPQELQGKKNKPAQKQTAPQIPILLILLVILLMALLVYGIVSKIFYSKKYLDENIRSKKIKEEK